MTPSTQNWLIEGDGMTTMTAPPGGMTAEEFEQWVALPANQGRWWELDQGRVIERPPPKPPHGTICAWIAHLLWAFAIARGRGRVTSNDTGLIVETDPDTVRGVDVMFFDATLSLDAIPAGYESDRPALAVEIRSPTDRANQMSRRIAQYLARGVPIVWVVDPADQTVAVHRPGGAIPDIAREDDEITGFDILPDLRIRARDLFTLPGQP